MSNSRKDVVIDPNGDLILQICSGTTDYFMKVSAKVLSVASPVFRTMLGSSAFLEGQGLQSASAVSPFSMKLHDDHYPSLLMVMNTVHLRMRRIPTKLSFDDFYHLAVVCDKYDLADIFLPWVPKWTAGLVEGRRTTACPKWLVISWVFQLEVVFVKITREMIFETPLSVDIGASGDTAVEIGILPTRVIDAIRQSRMKIANYLTSAAMREFVDYRLFMKTKHTICQATTVGDTPCAFRQACDTFSLGGLMRCLFVCELWPTTHESSLSIRTLVELIPQMEKFSYSVGSEFAKSHQLCGAQRRLAPVVFEVLLRIKGLKLSDFSQKDNS